MPAVNVSNSNQINLFAVGGSVTTLIVIKAYIGDRIYKQAILDCLEFTYYFNIILLTIVTSSFYLEQHVNQEAAAYTSISLALVTFLCILFCHIVHALWNTRCIKILVKDRIQRWRYLNTDEDQYHLSLSFPREIEMNSIDITTPTSSVVSFSPQHHCTAYTEEDESQCNSKSHSNAIDRKSEASSRSSLQVSNVHGEQDKSNTLHEPLLHNTPDEAKLNKTAVI